ncbi:MAG: DUF86 domain-containing protein [bacterium]
MRPDDKDMARLWDMLDAARAAVEFTGGLRFEVFLKDRKTRNAVERNLEIIGEAARGVSQETRHSYPDIPWQSIIGLRNVIAHEYGEILYEKIWGVCMSRLPMLIKQLETTAAENPAQEEER